MTYEIVPRYRSTGDTGTGMGTRSPGVGQRREYVASETPT
jgi:hypothetical protein